ncbi:MAG: adenylate/guanylate cyclase domain-containing protein [Nitrososphaeraceae archaeon]
MTVPGIDLLLGRKISNQEMEDNNLFLLIGQRGVGKTTYCKAFLANVLNSNSYIIYISSNITEKQFRNFFPGINSQTVLSNSLFINPFLKEEIENDSIVIREDSINQNKLNIDSKLFSTFKTIERRCLDICGTQVNLKKEELLTNETNLNYQNGKPSEKEYSNAVVVVVLDSISHLCTIFEEKDVLRFINFLAFFLKHNGIKAIFTVNNITLDQGVIEKVSTLFDTILEMKLYEDQIPEDSKRMIRISSFTGEKIVSNWLNVKLSKEGSLVFFDPLATIKKEHLICTVCKLPIIENPIFHQDMAFHKNHLDVYIRLHGIYGDSGITNIGQSIVLDASFFFTDIIGLSNPLLSVRKQIQKIELLNNIISLCSAFKKNMDKKILPTGDGMAIGFISNPEAPLELSVQLHKQLHKENANISDPDSKLGVRIGIASGSVFVVNDINNNQNIWGPGIIFARRVMDIGDGGHILIEGGLAQNLITLDDKYRDIIHYIGEHKIKHGQVMKMYSAYDHGNFGNPQQPLKFKSVLV